MKNEIFQLRDLCLRAHDTNSTCAKGVRRNERKNGMIRTELLTTEYSEVMQHNLISITAMSVIMARALPDVRDGLKPVQRRVALRYVRAWHLTTTSPTERVRVSSAIRMGKYHPHGDSSIYEALVVMAQEFKKGHAADRRPRQLRFHRGRRCGGDALYRGAPAEDLPQDVYSGRSG